MAVEEQSLLEARVQEKGGTVASLGKLGSYDVDDIRKRAKDAVKEIEGTILERKNDPKNAEIIKNFIKEFVRNCRSDLKDRLISSQLDDLANEIIDDILGFGVIQPLLLDPEITEIIVQGPGAGNIQIEKHGLMSWSELFFRNRQDIMDLIEKMISPINRRVDELNPMVDARLPDGSRVNAIIPPIAADGPYLTIRKFKPGFGLDDMIKLGAFTEREAELFKLVIEAELSILVSGGTGSGKTTTLNALSEFIPEGSPIVTIEDSLELVLKQSSVRRLETREPNVEGKGAITMRQLIKNALRMKVRWIIPGETRDGAAFDMLSGVNTGHCAMSTIHANDSNAAISRLETLCQMAEASLPVTAIRKLIASGFRLIIQTAQLKDGSRKVVQVTEIVGMDGDNVELEDILSFDYENKILKPTGFKPSFIEGLVKRGFVVPEWLR